MSNISKKDYLSIFSVQLTSNERVLFIFSRSEIKIMMTYGYLFGFIRLIKDTHHDEVFIEKTDHVIMRNNIRLYDYYGLRQLAMELGYNPHRLSKVNPQEIDIHG